MRSLYNLYNSQLSQARSQVRASSVAYTDPELASRAGNRLTDHSSGERERRPSALPTDGHIDLKEALNAE